MNNFADRIKLVRGSMTQSAFASELGINPNTLRAYEKGRSIPPADILARICGAFNISTEWALFGAGEMKVGKTSESRGCPEVEDELAQEIALTRELALETRQLLKENASLRVELERLKARSSPDEEMPPEATRDVA